MPSLFNFLSPASVATVCCVKGVLCLNSWYPQFFEKTEIDKTIIYKEEQVALFPSLHFLDWGCYGAKWDALIEINFQAKNMKELLPIDQFETPAALLCLWAWARVFSFNLQILTFLVPNMT